jgi:hypothetical protein
MQRFFDAIYLDNTMPTTRGMANLSFKKYIDGTHFDDTEAAARGEQLRLGTSLLGRGEYVSL